jgi:hypothetical protein
MAVELSATIEFRSGIQHLCVVTQCLVSGANLVNYKSPNVASSLMSGWVCRLQLLLALANAIILRSESHETHDHILLSQILDSFNLEGQVPYLYPPGTG